MLTISGRRPMKLLSKGAHAKVWALSTSLVAKEFELGDPTCTREFLLLQEVSQVPSLFPKVKERAVSDDYSKEVIIMERLYPLQPRAIEVDVRKEMFEQFSQKIKELHKCGYAHGDLRRNSDIGGEWDNIMPTLEGIRLIDLGNAQRRGEPLFESYVETDLRDLDDLKVWFLTE